jgi:hypothetical protein
MSVKQTIYRKQTKVLAIFKVMGLMVPILSLGTNPIQPTVTSLLKRKQYILQYNWDKAIIRIQEVAL